MRKLNNKGQIQGIMAIVVFFVGFGILTVVGYLLLTQSMDAIQSTSVNSSLIEKAGDRFEASVRILDSIAIIVLAVLLIGIGVASYKIAAPPIFWLITFVMAAFMGYVSYFFNYLFAEVVSQPVFSAITGIFPKLILICTNLHWVVLAGIIIGGITLYAKRDKGQFV